MSDTIFDIYRPAKERFPRLKDWKPIEGPKKEVKASSSDTRILRDPLSKQPLTIAFVYDFEKFPTVDKEGDTFYDAQEDTVEEEVAFDAEAESLEVEIRKTFEEFYSIDSKDLLFVDEIAVNTSGLALDTEQLLEYPKWTINGNRSLRTQVVIDAHHDSKQKKWQTLVAQSLNRYTSAHLSWSTTGIYGRYSGLGSRIASLNHYIYVDQELLKNMEMTIEQLRVMMNPVVPDSYLLLPFPPGKYSLPSEMIKQRRMQKSVFSETNTRYKNWASGMVQLAYNTNRQTVQLEDIRRLLANLSPFFTKQKDTEESVRMQNNVDAQRELQDQALQQINNVLASFFSKSQNGIPVEIQELANESIEDETAREQLITTLEEQFLKQYNEKKDEFEQLNDQEIELRKELEQTNKSIEEIEETLAERHINEEIIEEKTAEMERMQKLLQVTEKDLTRKDKELGILERNNLEEDRALKVRKENLEQKKEDLRYFESRIFPRTDVPSPFGEFFNQAGYFGVIDYLHNKIEQLSDLEERFVAEKNTENPFSNQNVILSFVNEFQDKLAVSEYRNLIGLFDFDDSLRGAIGYLATRNFKDNLPDFLEIKFQTAVDEINQNDIPDYEKQQLLVNFMQQFVKETQEDVDFLEKEQNNQEKKLVEIIQAIIDFLNDSEVDYKDIILQYFDEEKNNYNRVLYINNGLEIVQDGFKTFFRGKIQELLDQFAVFVDLVKKRDIDLEIEKPNELSGTDEIYGKTSNFIKQQKETLEPLNAYIGTHVGNQAIFLEKAEEQLEAFKEYLKNKLEELGRFYYNEAQSKTAGISLSEKQRELQRLRENKILSERVTKRSKIDQLKADIEVLLKIADPLLISLKDEIQELEEDYQNSVENTQMLKKNNVVQTNNLKAEKLELEKAKKELETTVGELEREIEELKLFLEASESKTDQELQNELDNLNRQREELSEKIQEKEVELTSLQQSLDPIQQKIVDLRFIQRAFTNLEGGIEGLEQKLRQKIEGIVDRSFVHAQPVYNLAKQWVETLVDNLTKVPPPEFSQNFNPTNTYDAVILFKQVSKRTFWDEVDLWQNQRLGIKNT